MSEIPPGTVLKLGPADLAALADAIATAFKPHQLAILVAERLNRKMDDYLSGPTHKDHAYFLVRTAEQEEWLVALLSAVSLEKRGSELSSMIEARLRVSGAASLEAMLEQGHQINEAIAIDRLYHWVCRIRAVGNIGGNPVEAHGSGILIAPDLVLTNYHVLRDINTCGGLAAASVIFDHVPGKQSRAVPLNKEWRAPCRIFNNRDGLPDQLRPADIELDYAILRLAEEVGNQAVNGAGGAPREWLRLRDPATELPPVPGPNSAVIIFQYPKFQGQPPNPLQWSMGVSTASPWPDLRFRYTAPTARGSSGSPCFNHNCEFVALHHAADGAANPQFNQGIPVAAIIRDLVTWENEFTGQGSDLPWKFQPPPNAINGDPAQVAGDRVGGSGGNVASPANGSSPVKDALGSMLIGKLPSIVFVNRSNFRQHLKSLMPADTGYRVVAVQGQECTGKSHSRHLVEHVGKSSGILVAYFDASVPQAIEDACFQLADLMAFSNATMEDLEKRVLSDAADPARIGRKFASWLTRATSETPDRWWLMIDGLAPANNPDPVIRDHLVGALIEAARVNPRFTKVKLILLGSQPPTDPYLANFTLNDPLEPLHPGDIKLLLKDQAERQGKALSDEEAELLAEKLLGPGSGTLTPAQMRNLQTGIPEILNVLSS